MTISGHRTISTFLRYDIASEEDKREVLRKVEARAVSEAAQRSNVAPIHKHGENTENRGSEAGEASAKSLGKWCARRDSNARPLAPEGRTGRSRRHLTTAQGREGNELARSVPSWTVLEFRQDTEKTRRIGRLNFRDTDVFRRVTGGASAASEGLTVGTLAAPKPPTESAAPAPAHHPCGDGRLNRDRALTRAAKGHGR